VQHLDLILALVGGLTAALLFGYATHRLGLSPLVGYLLAGIVVGSNTPGLIVDQGVTQQLAEVGVSLLMFGVGLHFRWEELLAVRRVAVPGAIGTSAVATALGCVVALAFGWGASAGFVFGLAVSVASTVVLLRVLTDRRDLHSPTGHIAVGWVVIEDFLTVMVLVLLPVLADFGEVGWSGALWAIGGAFLKVSALIAFAIYFGGRAIPWVLGHIAATRSRELFTLTILVLALGIAVGAAFLFGVSLALGAFLAGLVVGRSEFSLRAASEALPMRDAFAVLFFVSVGMLFDPAFLLASPGLVAATLGVVLLGKPLTALFLVLVLGHPLRVALGVAVALAQIGEFSFIVAGLGRQLELLPEAATQALVAASMISISLNPILFRVANAVEARAKRSPRAWKLLNAVSDEERLRSENDIRDADLRDEHAAIVVGYGPVGRTVTRLLRENGIEPTVIEMNLDTVRTLREEGIRAVYGDATHRATIEQAGVEQAIALILSSSGMQGSEETIRVARELNPRIRVLARSAYLREVAALEQAGADVVFSGEGEVALTMTEFILRQLGATPEQIDRERDRNRAEFLGSRREDTPLLPA